MKKSFLSFALVAVLVLSLSSCRGSKSLIVPHAISTVDATPVAALNLKPGDYDIFASVTTTASVNVKYGRYELKIQSGDGDFSYKFKFDSKEGWSLDRFSGVANLGYLTTDISTSADELPNAEEFARRVAIGRLIEIVKDYGADGVLEPVVTTKATDVGGSTIEYQATVTAKIVKIHSTAK